MPAIETLTLRRDRRTGAGTFLLHWRDPAKVATAAGVYGLIPAGEFQPSSIASRDRENDFDLWRNVVREYSEELLGQPERDGSQVSRSTMRTGLSIGPSNRPGDTHGSTPTVSASVSTH